MVQVGVVVIEVFLGVQILEVSPRADSGDLVAPVGGVGNIWSVGVPERIGTKQSKSFGIVNDGRVLALGFAVLSTHANRLVSGKGIANLFDLETQSFL